MIAYLPSQCGKEKGELIMITATWSLRQWNHIQSVANKSVYMCSVYKVLYSEE